MIQEQKQLLLKDLCARLMYDVMVNYDNHICTLNEIDPACKDIDYITVRIQDIERLACAKSVTVESIKPYLRPMSSLVGKELDECRETCKYRKVGQSVLDCATPQTIDYLISHHFDYRGLIEKGLALEAPKDMYRTE